MREFSKRLARLEAKTTTKPRIFWLHTTDPAAKRQEIASMIQAGEARSTDMFVSWLPYQEPEPLDD